MIGNIRYIFRVTKTRMVRSLLGELLHGMLLATPTGILLLVIWELFEPVPDTTYLWKLVAIMVGSFLVQMFVASKIYAYTNTIVYKMSCKLRIILGDRLQQLSLGFYKKRDPGDLASVILQDVTNVETILGHALPDIFGAVFGTLFLSLFLLATDWKLALLMLLAIPVAFLFAFLATLLMEQFSHAQVRFRNETGSRFIEYIMGIRHLKAYNQTGEKFTTLETAFNALRKASIKLEAIPGPMVLMTFVAFEFFFLFMIYLGLGRLAEETLSIQALVAFLIIGYRLYEPLKILMIDYAMINYMNVSLNRIIDLLETPLQEKGKDLQPDLHDIEFQGVTFSYIDRDILKDVSFTIPQRRMTALVGASGSGKTTIANLIARFWDVQKGHISIGGIDIREMSPNTVYRLISEVFQDVYLFDDTVRNNILIGKPEATEDEILEVAKKAQVTEFLHQLPDGLDTRVGEGGSHLSGGQKQRISIARAMLKDAPIILLDEATASLDPENEIYIQQAIQELVKEKTVVVIAHKLQTIKNADKIIVLEHGKIKEQGRHTDLLKNNLLYANYWRNQKMTTGWKLFDEKTKQKESAVKPGL
ncbi:MAG: ABC transporter ATP-binding protein [Bacteroidota bacterium]